MRLSGMGRTRSVRPGRELDPSALPEKEVCYRYTTGPLPVVCSRHTSRKMLLVSILRGDQRSIFGKVVFLWSTADPKDGCP
jgi:hypothetical protein